MSSESNSESAPDNWWLYRRTDDDHFVFAYEFSKSVLCHVQHPSDWLVRVDRADGTILFSQHDLQSRAAAIDLAESVIHSQRTSVPQVCTKYLVSIIRQ
jgi:hypothetical protein